MTYDGGNLCTRYVAWVIQAHRIDYVVHGDDPCIVDGKDVYESAKALGKYLSIPRTEGVSTTEIVGRMLTLTTDHHAAAADDIASPAAVIKPAPAAGHGHSAKKTATTPKVTTPLLGPASQRQSPAGSPPSGPPRTPGGGLLISGFALDESPSNSPAAARTAEGAAAATPGGPKREGAESSVRVTTPRHHRVTTPRDHRVTTPRHHRVTIV